MANFKSKIKNETKKLDPKQKKAVIIFAVLIGLVIVMLLLNFILDIVSEMKSRETEETVYLCEPDWTLNILEDENYTCLDRFIYYTNGALSTRIYNETDAKNTDFYAVFFYSYFNAMINGKYENFSGYYTQSYINKNGDFDMFTMQQIYDISVEYYGAETGSDSDTRTVSFRVAFSIRRNDGTLWKNLESNTCRPMLFTAVESLGDGTMEIDSVEFCN